MTRYPSPRSAAVQTTYQLNTAELRAAVVEYVARHRGAMGRDVDVTFAVGDSYPSGGDEITAAVTLDTTAAA